MLTSTGHELTGLVRGESVFVPIRACIEQPRSSGSVIELGFARQLLSRLSSQSGITCRPPPARDQACAAR